MSTKFTFDGPNLLAIIKPGVTAVDIQQELYSAWKEDLRLAVGDDLSKFPPLFIESIGGNDFGGGKVLSPFLIFNNTDGWRIRGPEENSEIVLDGNLFPESPATAITVPTIGAFTQSLIFQRSVDAFTVTTGGGDPASIADAVWDEQKSGHVTPGSFGEEVQDHALSSEVPTASQNAGAVWDEPQSTHTASGSLGEVLSNLSSDMNIILSLTHDNAVIDNQSWSTIAGQPRLISATVKSYNSKVNADLNDGATGLVHQFEMLAVYDGSGNQSSFKLTRTGS